MRLLQNPSRHICLHETMFTDKPATMIFGVESQEIILEKPKMHHPLRFISQWYCGTSKCCYCGVSKATARTVSPPLLQFCATQLGVTWFVNSLRNHLQPGHHTRQYNPKGGLHLQLTTLFDYIMWTLSIHPSFMRATCDLSCPNNQGERRVGQTFSHFPKKTNPEQNRPTPNKDFFPMCIPPREKDKAQTTLGRWQLCCFLPYWQGLKNNGSENT